MEDQAAKDQADRRVLIFAARPTAMP